MTDDAAIVTPLPGDIVTFDISGVASSATEWLDAFDAAGIRQSRSDEGATRWQLVTVTGDDDAQTYVFRQDTDHTIVVQLPVAAVMAAAAADAMTLTPDHTLYLGTDGDVHGVLLHGLTAGQTVTVTGVDGEARDGRVTSVDASGDAFTLRYEGEDTVTAYEFQGDGLLPVGIVNITPAAEEKEETVTDTTVTNATPSDGPPDTSGFVDLVVLEEVDSAARVYTEEEQENDFLEDWIQRPVKGYPATLTRSRFALTDTFALFRELMREHAAAGDESAMVDMSANAPPALMPLSQVTVAVYTTEDERAAVTAVTGLEVRGDVDAAVTQFNAHDVATLPKEQSVDAMMLQEFEETQPWRAVDASGAVSVTTDTPFLRISNTTLSGAALRVGAWSEEVTRQGQAVRRVFHGHPVPFSLQRAVTGFTRLERSGDDGSETVAIPADALCVDGWLYSPFPAPRNTGYLPSDVVHGSSLRSLPPSRVLLYDVHRSLSTRNRPLADALFPDGAPDALPAFIQTATKLDPAHAALVAPTVAWPPLVTYISAVTDGAGVAGPHDLLQPLAYVGRRTQSLPASAAAAVSAVVTKTVDAWTTHTAALKEAAGAAIGAVADAVRSAPAGTSYDLCLTSYANPLDEPLRATLTPRMFGVAAWDLFTHLPAEAWVRAGMRPYVDTYWAARMAGDAEGAGEALEAMRPRVRVLTTAEAAATASVTARGHPRPEHNSCPHIPYAAQLAERNHDRAGIAGVATIRDMLQRFRGKREGAWVHCIQCRRELICVHELLLVDAAERPEEADVITKEIILRFGHHGVEGRRHVCGNCGKTWRLLDLDDDPAAGGRGSDNADDMVVGVAADGDDDLMGDAGTLIDGYDGDVWKDEADVKPDASEAPGAAAAVVGDPATDPVAAAAPSPIKTRVALRMFRDIADAAGITLTHEAEVALAAESHSFPRRPDVAGPVTKVEPRVIRYIARFAALLIVIARRDASLLPMQRRTADDDGCGKERSDDPSEGDAVNERCLSRALAAMRPLIHDPWRRLPRLAAGEGRARKARVDALFAQINLAVHGIATTQSDDGAADAPAAIVTESFRVPGEFRPRLVRDADASGTVVTLSEAPGASVSEYNAAVDVLLQVVSSAANDAVTATTGVLGIPPSFTPGLPIADVSTASAGAAYGATAFVAHTVTGDVSGVLAFVRDAGAAYEAAWEARGVHSTWQTGAAGANTEQTTTATLDEADWQNLNARACATGSNIGGAHRFINGTCVYCGITRGDDDDAEVDAQKLTITPAEGEALLDRMRLRHTLTAETSNTDDTSPAAIAAVAQLFPDLHTDDERLAHPVAALVIALYTQKVKLSAATLNQLVTRLAARLTAAREGLKLPPEAATALQRLLSTSRDAACRDIAQFVALPLARWASADTTALHWLRRVQTNRYEWAKLYADHRQDVDAFLAANVERLPTEDPDDFRDATLRCVQRLQALQRLREAWASGLETRLAAVPSLPANFSAAFVVQRAFECAVYEVLGPWQRAISEATRGKAKGGVAAYLAECIGRWSQWAMRMQLAAADALLQHQAEAEKDGVLREFEAENEDVKHLLLIQKKLGIGRFRAGDVQRYDDDVYRRDKDLARRLALAATPLEGKE